MLRTCAREVARCEPVRLNDDPTVSVVVCAFNEVEHIGRLLDSLSEQTRAPDEVVVVDDGSRDQTGSIASGRGAQLVRVRHGGPARGRNVGARCASGAILVFLDADMACSPQFLERLIEPIIDGAVGSFTREIFVGNLENRWAAAYSTMRGLEDGRLLAPDFPERWDNFRAIRRDAFLSVGGNDDVGYGEDRTLARKLGISAVVAPGAECLHFNPSSLSELFFNGRWIGRGPQIREIRPPWRDHLPHRVARWTLEDTRKGVGLATATAARLAYHGGIWLGLAGSTARPNWHWK